MRRIGYVGAAMLAVFISMVSIAVRAGDRPRSAPSYAELWVSRENLSRMIRYHGTIALKITDEAVYAWRQGEWVRVMENP
jgi:hypothetical protein